MAFGNRIGDGDTRRLAGVVALAAVLAIGCASSPEPQPQPEPQSQAEFDSGTLEGSEISGADIGEGMRMPDLESVYFDFDRATIRDDQKATLRSNSSAIDGEGFRTVVIEGHCDERGSEEYNLALGERRALAVKQYLTNLGVPRQSLDTVSFGESKPAVQGHDESAWRWNRRAEFRVVR